MHVKRNYFTSSFLHTSLRRLFRRCLCSLELSFVDTQPELLRHQASKVNRETVSIVEPPHILAGEFLLSSLQSFLRVLLEEFLATIERT